MNLPPRPKLRTNRDIADHVADVLSALDDLINHDDADAALKYFLDEIDEFIEFLNRVHDNLRHAGEPDPDAIYDRWKDEGKPLTWLGMPRR